MPERVVLQQLYEGQIAARVVNAGDDKKETTADNKTITGGVKKIEGKQMENCFVAWENNHEISIIFCSISHVRKFSWLAPRGDQSATSLTTTFRTTYRRPHSGPVWLVLPSWLVDPYFTLLLC